LSMPSTSSSNVSVAKAIQACGLESSSIMFGLYCGLRPDGHKGERAVKFCSAESNEKSKEKTAENRAKAQ
jgi:hypothetical protein